jgi:nucleoside-diphosphate-sugar epimerase
MTSSSREPGTRLAVVTGAAGFVGRHLVSGLVERGWQVRAVDLPGSAPSDPGEHLEWVEGDIRDATLIDRIFDGADTVFHLASAHLQVGAPADWYRSVNVDAIGPLVEACADSGVRRLVHTSSVGIYGHVTAPPADEDSAKHPVNDYEKTKLEGERLVILEAERVGLDLVVLRPGWVYGPGCPRTAKLLRSIRKGRFVYVGPGHNLRHPIHIDDMVAAFEHAAAAPSQASGKAYLIVGPEPVTVRGLVESCATALQVRPPGLRLPRNVAILLGWMIEAVFSILPGEPPFSRRSLAFFDNDNAFDGSRATRELGFRPTIDLDTGLARTLSEMEQAV